MDDSSELFRSPYGVQLIGPDVPSYKASASGYMIPYLSVSMVPGDETKLNLVIGSRIITADHEEAHKWIDFIAHAMAYAAGYSTHGEHSRIRNPYGVKVMHIESVYSEPDDGTGEAKGENI